MPLRSDQGDSDANSKIIRLMDRDNEMEALLACLKYLYGEATKLDLRLAAHFIGVAAETVQETIDRAE